MMEPSSSNQDSTPPDESFRWPAYFQRSNEALFFLNRQRRLLFANRAWEKLTGTPLREIRGVACRRRPLGPDPEKMESLRHVLTPPPEVLAGKPGRTRRLLPAVLAGTSMEAARWWDIAFFPFTDATGLLGVLGKITPVPREGLFESQPLPEKIIAVRQRFTAAFALEQMASELPQMRRLAEQVRLAAQTGTPALLLGEPGTGKQWTARCIHQQSRRREGVFAAIDCARLPSRAVAELLSGQAGLARRLRPGTLYLREPACLPRELQERLLEMIASWKQDGTSEKLGILAGTCRPPDDDIRSGQLLAELHCTLSPMVLVVPPLRDRLDDLPWLAEKLLVRGGLASESAVAGLTEAALSILRGYSWGGNIRELYDVLVAACARAKGQQIDAGDLPFHVRVAQPAAPRAALPLDALLEQVERRLILLALRETQHNKTEAAELLAVWRQRLVRRMEALGIPDTP